MNFLSQCQNLLPWLSQIRRDFHMHPELGFEEHRTAAKIQEILGQLNIPFQKNIAQTGTIAHIKGTDPKFTIALRADIDALPIQEANDTPYKSTIQGKMHACGHDAHTTVLLGVAKACAEGIFKPPCNLRLIFQPAEETTGGAAPMIAEGALDGVQAVLGLHVNSALETGTAAVRYGVMHAASDMFTIKIKGLSSHGAYPSDGIDAILIAAHLITALQSIVSRNTDSREALVLSIGTIKGGAARNIVCDAVELTGVIRSLNPSVREKANKRVKELTESIAKSFGGRGEYIRMPSYIPLINHKPLVDLIKKEAVNLLGVKKVFEHPAPNMGVEDFAYYLEKVPGAFWHLGVGNKKKGIAAPAHNEHFDIDENSLPIGTALQCLNSQAIYNALAKGETLRDH